MNSSNLSLKIILLISVILIFAGCESKPDFTVVKGKVLATDNSPLLKADVSLNYTTGGQPIQTVKVDNDGSYEIKIKNEGIFNLTFSGVNHEAVTAPILIDRKDIIQLDVKLESYKYVDNFEDVNIIGDFNKFRFRTAQRMTKQDDGTFTSEFKTDKDSSSLSITRGRKNRQKYKWNNG